MKRSFFHLLVSLATAALALWGVITHSAGWPPPGQVLAAFMAVGLAGTLVDLAVWRPSTVFYEDLIRAVARYALLGVVALVAIEFFRMTLGVRVGPAGPALVFHAWSLTWSPART